MYICIQNRNNSKIFAIVPRTACFGGKKFKKKKHKKMSDPELNVLGEESEDSDFDENAEAKEEKIKETSDSEPPLSRRNRNKEEVLEDEGPLEENDEEGEDLFGDDMFK
jgi:hypothetical protein